MGLHISSLVIEGYQSVVDTPKYCGYFLEAFMNIDPKKLRALIREHMDELASDIEDELGITEEVHDEESDPSVDNDESSEDQNEDSEEAADKSEDATLVDEAAEKVSSGNGDKKLMELAKDVTEENNPPEWVASEAIWERAKKAVEPKWDDYDQPYAVVAHVYESMGGKIK